MRDYEWADCVICFESSKCHYWSSTSVEVLRIILTLLKAQDMREQSIKDAIDHISNSRHYLEIAKQKLHIFTYWSGGYRYWHLPEQLLKSAGDNE